MMTTILVHAQQVTVINLYNTGVSNSGAPLANTTIGDPHYALTIVPAGSTNAIRALTTRGQWIAGDSISDWIGPQNPGTNGFSDTDDYGPVGEYTYETSFNISGGNPATASITGRFAIDNELVGIYLNGSSLGISNLNSSSAAYNSWHNFTIPPSAGFRSGQNTLDFVVNNDNGPTGLRVEMTASAKLKMNQLGTNVVVTWPVYATGFILQSTTNLAPPAAWSAVLTTPGIVGTNNSVTNGFTGKQMFYRLSQ